MVSLRLGLGPRAGPVVARQDELTGRVKGGGDLCAGWGLIEPFAEPVDRGKAAEAVVRAFPVIEVLPVGRLGFEIWVVEVDGRPELLESGALDALDLAVQMRRARADRSELDAPGAQPGLDLDGEELLATVRLNAALSRRASRRSAGRERSASTSPTG